MSCKTSSFLACFTQLTSGETVGMKLAQCFPLLRTGCSVKSPPYTCFNPSL